MTIVTNNFKALFFEILKDAFKKFQLDKNVKTHHQIFTKTWLQTSSHSNSTHQNPSHFTQFLMGHKIK
jgi:hypothetical protein